MVSQSVAAVEKIDFWRCVAKRAVAVYGQETIMMKATWIGSLACPPNMRMHLPKPRAPFSMADQVTSASSQVIRGR